MEINKNENKTAYLVTRINEIKDKINIIIYSDEHTSESKKLASEIMSIINDIDWHWRDMESYTKSKTLSSIKYFLWPILKTTGIFLMASTLLILPAIFTGIIVLDNRVFSYLAVIILTGFIVSFLSLFTGSTTNRGAA